MMKNRYEAFTKNLLECKDMFRYFCIYYRYDGEQKCVPLVVDKMNKINLDPKEKIERIEGRPVRLRFRELGPWLRLMDDFICNDPTLKIMIVDWEAYDKTKVVVAVGQNSKWTIRANYSQALSQVLVGNLNSKVSLLNAS